MRPSASTVGVKARPTPYCLNSTLCAPSPVLIRIGNSPPARKLAVSPERAVSVGSARITARPLCSARLSVESRSNPRSFPAKPNVVAAAGELNVPLTPLEPAVIVPASPRERPNWKPPVRSKDVRLTPTSLLNERLTSAKRTFNITWSGVAVLSRLMTLV